MKAVIFDMDGVLVDTETIYMQMFYDLFTNNGFRVDKEDIYSIIGTSTETTWRLLGDMVVPSISANDVAELYHSKIPDHNNINFYDLKFPHVQQIMKKLTDRGIKIAIASSAPVEDIEKVIDQCNLNKYIDYFISGDSLIESKPNPEIYLHVMGKLNVKKENTIIIEDSYSGILAGKNSGAFVIAIKDRKFGINQTDADLIVPELLEAYNFILNKFTLQA